MYACEIEVGGGNSECEPHLAWPKDAVIAFHVQYLAIAYGHLFLYLSNNGEIEQGSHASSRERGGTREEIRRPREKRTLFEKCTLARGTVR